MKQKEFPKKDGTKGVNYKPEAGDSFIAKAKTVGTRMNPAIVKGKAVIIENHFLSVETKDGKLITIDVTAGQKKICDKTSDLNGKTISFEKYVHPQYGDQIGVRVK